MDARMLLARGRPRERFGASSISRGASGVVARGAGISSVRATAQATATALLADKGNASIVSEAEAPARRADKEDVVVGGDALKRAKAASHSSR